jgi:hypothetical protein
MDDCETRGLGRGWVTTQFKEEIDFHHHPRRCCFNKANPELEKRQPASQLANTHTHVYIMQFLTKALLLFLTALSKTAVVWADDGIDDLFLVDEEVDDDKEVVDGAVDTDDIEEDDDDGTDRTAPVDATLRLEFVPAISYQQTLHQEHDKLFFLPQNSNIPNTTTMDDDGCWYQCVADICQTVCGGTFTVDYSLAEDNAMQFIFTFPTDTLLRPAASDPRIRVAVFVQTIDCTDGELLLNKFITANQIDYVGGNVTGLVDTFDPDVRTNYNYLDCSFSCCQSLLTTHVSLSFTISTTTNNRNHLSRLHGVASLPNSNLSHRTRLVCGKRT